MIKKIGILTSGGDAPGMNTVINSIVLNSIKNKIKVYGIYNGYYGLFNNKFKLLNKKHILNINNKGGTILGSSRFNLLKTNNINKKIIKKIKSKIDILIIIGGEGSYKGALKLNNLKLPCITIPGTIDNDIYGTDYTIGFSTSLENITKYIDNIKYTIESHNRIMLIEVMGKKCGDLAIFSSIASNCKYFIIPEINYDINNIIFNINKKKNKNYIIIITENIVNIKKLSIKIENLTNKETRYTSLGYIQRGGIPNTFDRILAHRIGFYTINKLIKKNITGICVGIKKNKIIHYKLKNFKQKKNKKLNKEFLKIVKNLN